MSDFVVFTDSTADLPSKLANELGVVILSLEYTIDGNTYFDDPHNPPMALRDFYALLRTGKLSTTSQVNVARFAEAFTQVLENGQDVFYMGFSSNLSGTFQSGQVAAAELAPRYPERKIRCVDTCAASMGEGLLVYLAVMKQREGLSIDELQAYVEKTRDHLCHWFTVDDLNHLKRGGRLSATSAFVGGMLGIKPVLHVNEEGRLIPASKVRGRKASLNALVEQMEKTAINPSEQTVFISHGDSPEDAEYVASLVRSKCKPKEIRIGCIGPIIGAHTGPGALALFFLGTQK